MSPSKFAILPFSLSIANSSEQAAAESQSKQHPDFSFIKELKLQPLNPKIGALAGNYVLEHSCAIMFGYGGCRWWKTMWSHLVSKDALKVFDKSFQ